VICDDEKIKGLKKFYMGIKKRKKKYKIREMRKRS
jgi:hypothetical protein